MADLRVPPTASRLDKVTDHNPLRLESHQAEFPVQVQKQLSRLDNELVVRIVERL
jgi:hypothetical protein